MWSAPNLPEAGTQSGRPIGSRFLTACLTLVQTTESEKEPKQIAFRMEAFVS